MPHRTRFILPMLSAALLLNGCDKSQPPATNVPADHALVGAWRSKVTFRSGSLAEMKDLEFLLSYNSGGTMTESSNYDEAANSSPPAYGIWKQTAPQTFQTKYLFYSTKEQAPGKGPRSTDWWPAGHGVITETLTLSVDGQTYSSIIKLDMFDTADAPIAGGGEGTASGTRIVF